MTFDQSDLRLLNPRETPSDSDVEVVGTIPLTMEAARCRIHYLQLNGKRSPKRMLGAQRGHVSLVKRKTRLWKRAPCYALIKPSVRLCFSSALWFNEEAARITVGASQAKRLHRRRHVLGASVRQLRG